MKVVFMILFILVLLFIGLCILGAYEIAMDAKASRKHKEAMEEWTRRLP